MHACYIRGSGERYMLDFRDWDLIILVKHVKLVFINTKFLLMI